MTVPSVYMTVYPMIPKDEVGQFIENDEVDLTAAPWQETARQSVDKWIESSYSM